MPTQKLNIDIVAKDKTRKAMRSAEGGLSKLKKAVFSFKGALAGIGAGLAVRSIARTAAEFEDLRDALSSVTGTVKGGQDAFNFISDFALRTQFDVQTLTRAFITLKATGIAPTAELLTVFTDTAAVTTDQLGTFESLVRVLSRSTAGGLGLEELNQIADRGIPVWDIFSEKLGLSRLELSAMGQSASGAAKLTKVLLDGLKERFGGATATKLDNLSTAMSNFGIAVDQVKDSFAAAGFGPAITDIINNLSEWIKKNNDLITNLGKLTGVIVEFAASAVGLLAKGLVTVVDAIGNIASDAKQKFDIIKYNILDSKNAVSQFRQEFTTIAPAIDSAATASDRLKKKELQNTKELALAKKEYNATLEKYHTKEQKAQATFDEHYETLINNKHFATLSTDKQTESVMILVDAYAKAVEASDDLTDAQETAKDIAEDMGMTFESAFENAVLNGNKFRDVLQGIYKDILRIILRKTVTEKVGGFVSSFIEGVIPSAQFGGSVKGGQPHLVGEAGPELFVPSSSGSVIPNHQLGGGSNIVQNINVTTGVQQTVRAEIIQLMPMIKKASVEAVLEERSRGGQMAQAMGAVNQNS